MKVVQEEGVGNLWWQVQLVASLGNAKCGIIFNIENIEKKFLIDNRVTFISTCMYDITLLYTIIHIIFLFSLFLS